MTDYSSAWQITCLENDAPRLAPDLAVPHLGAPPRDTPGRLAKRNLWGIGPPDHSCAWENDVPSQMVCPLGQVCFSSGTPFIQTR